MPATPIRLRYIALICLLLSTSSHGAVDNLEIPPNAGCACPDDELTYTCTNIGAGNTIWRGTAFDCDGSSNDIILRHSQFAGSGSRGTCTSNTLRAQSLRVENGNCFVSQLDATVSTSINGQSIGCYHNSDTGTRLVGESVLNVISADNPYPAPTNVSLAEITEGQVTFNWTAICSTAQFLVDSDCGVCPSSTNTSTVNCTGFQLPTGSGDTMCSFMVNGRACGRTSDLITTAVLRVPDAPTVSIIPTYSNETRLLTQLEFTPEIQSEVISGDISGPVLNYFPAFVSSNGDATNVQSQSGEGPFNYTVDVPSELCSSGSTVRVNITAANRVGQGFPSDTETIGCVNNFVRVNFYPQNSTVTCTFIDELDTTERFCRIDYGLYDKGLTSSSQGNAINDSPNTVSLTLMNLGDGRYRYIILASSNMTTVRVEGNFTKESPSEGSYVIIVAIVVPVVTILVIATVTVVLVIICVCRTSPPTQYPVESGVHREYVPLNSSKKDPHKVLKLKEIIGRDLKVYEVESNCDLGEFIEGKPEGEAGKYVYSRGCAFYPLTDKSENVYGGQEIILQKKSTGKLYSPQVDSSVLQSERLLGEGVSRPNYSDDYRVFVQSMGSGKRHLQAKTHVIHEEPEHKKDLKQSGSATEKKTTSLDIRGYKKQPLILPAPKDYFVTEQVDAKDMTLIKFWKTHGLRKKKLNVFLEVDQMVQKPIKVRDVLLMDKGTGGKLFIDPVALSKMKEGREQEIDSKWRVLVAGEYKDYKKVILEPGSWVAYENPKFVYGSKFRALVVQDDNVRMSDFISREIGVFERGKAFYELKKGEVEDLLYCKKAMVVADGVIPQLLEKEDSSAPSIKWLPEATIAAFYSIDPNVPGEGISPPTSKENTFFIHSTSQGSRCLKKGTVVLYNCGVDESKNGDAHVDSDQEDDDGHEVTANTDTALTPLIPVKNGHREEVETPPQI